MTISSQTSRISYVGNGSTTAFAVPFYFSADSDLVVSVQDTNGNVTTKTLGTDYILVGATLSAGGTCGFISPPTTGYIIAIYRVPPITQTTSYNNNDPFPAESHELALDKTATIDQYLKTQIDRAILVDPTDTPPMTTLPVASLRALKTLSFDASGNPSATTPIAAGTTVSSVMIPVVTSSTLTLARIALGLGNTTVAISTNTAINAASQNSNRYIATGALNLTLSRANTFTNGFGFWLEVVSTGGDVTLIPNVNDTIAGALTAGSNIVVPAGDKVFITTDGASSGKWFIEQQSYTLGNVKRISTTPYTITQADHRRILSFNGAAVQAITFPAGNTLPTDFHCVIYNEETTAVGKGIAGTDVGTFTLYPTQSYLVQNVNNVVKLIGGIQPYKVSSVALFVNSTLGSDSPLVADGLAAGARAFATQTAAKNALYRDFNHNGSQPTVTLTGTFDEPITFGGQPSNCGVFFWNGSSAGAYTTRATAPLPYCFIIGDGAVVEMTNVTFSGNGINSTAIQLHQTAILDILTGCSFGAFGTGNHFASDGSGWTLNIDNSYAVTGGATNHFGMVGGGTVNHAGSITVTTTGAPTIGVWFKGTGSVLFSLGSTITWTGAPAAGTTKWAMGPQAAISLSGNAANVPGSLAGSPVTGSAPAAATGWATA